jgi:hypothetical protein
MSQSAGLLSITFLVFIIPPPPPIASLAPLSSRIAIVGELLQSMLQDEVFE